MMSREFYNSIMKDKVECKGKNVVGAFMDVPIFVRKFSVETHFAVVENMDSYRDQDMGDIIFREPFYKASCVETRRSDGLITIHNGNDNVTYQMAQSHPRTSLENKSTKLEKYQSSRILLIMEYLVKISKKTRIMELKRRNLKITVLTSYTPYPSRKMLGLKAF
ncbi:hypothetical protein Tco_1017583 [Tanacetum coccineum]|uniref:Uncharacterized protein n=1 Tax=Tanacetum coccineum TaxID=301880 RepID=A0ABQ5FRV5_9ASTR